MVSAATGWVMAFSIAVVCCLILALVHVPRFQPSEDVLSCDRDGGYWSSAEAACKKTDSPLAGLAS
ncbi:MAG: hypothetical protein AAF479_10480 [Pseudomonadota bacterium]